MNRGDGLVERARREARGFVEFKHQELFDKLADRIEALEWEQREVNISLDTLPFWPWLWADPAMERGDEQIIAAEKRLRVNYETAREPIPNQYALVHRWDLTTLMHAFWRHRARSGLLTEKLAALTVSEALVTSLRNQLEGAKEALRPFADVAFGRESMGGEVEIEIIRTAQPLEYSVGPNVRRARLLMKEFRLAASTLDRLEGDQEIGASVARAEVAASTGVKSDSAEGH